MADITKEKGIVEKIKGLSGYFWYNIIFGILAITGLIVAIVGKVNEPKLNQKCWEDDKMCDAEELELKKKYANDHTALIGGIMLGVGIGLLVLGLMVKPR